MQENSKCMGVGIGDLEEDGGMYVALSEGLGRCVWRGGCGCGLRCVVVCGWVWVCVCVGGCGCVWVCGCVKVCVWLQLQPRVPGLLTLGSRKVSCDSGPAGPRFINTVPFITGSWLVSTGSRTLVAVTTLSRANTSRKYRIGLRRPSAH